MTSEYRAQLAVTKVLETIEEQSFGEPVWTANELYLIAKSLVFAVRKSDLYHDSHLQPLLFSNKDYQEDGAFF